MAAASFFRSLYLKHLVKPQGERAIFKSFGKVKPQRIVEVGMDSGDRAMDLIELAQRHRPTVEVRYCGLDLFDANPSKDRLELKEAHRMLKPTGAKIQLIPGEPLPSMARVANNLASTDLLILSASALSQHAPDWYFVPRMLNDHSVVFVQTEADGPFEKLNFKQVELLAQDAQSSSRKAA